MDDASSVVYAVQLAAELVMIDTGCRKACGGRLWHESLRHELGARGVEYRRQGVLEYFQFGPGDPIASNSL